MAGDTWRDDERPGSPGELPTAPGTPSASRAETQQRTGRPAPTVRDTSDPRQRGESSHSVLHLPSALSGHWHIESELLSRGAEADLLLVADGAGERRVAKIYRTGIEPKTEVLQRVGGTSFEHVVHLFDHGRSDGRWYELLEYVENGSLEDLIRQEGPKLSEPRIREILVEIASAIDHLHSHDVVHRDIKPSNILVRILQPLDLVLTDFGIASVLGQGSRRFTTGNRTIAYAAPETSAGEVSKAADWWSLGIILVEILTGRHPFAGTHPGELLDERAIMSRLVQMPVDQLAEGAVDPWRTLCRGLLRREAKNRWGNGEIERWLQGDATLKVAEEAPTIFHEFPPFFFSGTGKKYTTLPEIAQAFGESWAEARKVVERGHLLNWVKDDLRDNEWRQFLSDLDRDCRDLDERIFRIIVKLDPKTTPAFCGYRLDPDGLQRLANDALANAGPARSALATLFDRRILVTTAEATGIAHYRDLHESWNAQIESYKAQSDAVIRAGAPQSAINESRDQARSAMLLSVLPSGQGYTNELRKWAREAAKPELQECTWFQALGDPSRASPPAAFLIHLLAPHAEAPAAEARTIRLQREAERRNAKIAFWAKLGLAGFVIAAIVGFLLWYNSPANVAARQEEQRRAEMIRQEQGRQRQEQERERQAAERVRAAENARAALRFQSVGEASRNGCSQGALSAARALATTRSRQNVEVLKDALSFVILVEFVSGNCLNVYFDALAQIDMPGWRNITYYYNRGGWPIFRRMIVEQIENIRRGDQSFTNPSQSGPFVAPGRARDRLAIMLQRLGKYSVFGGGRQIWYSPQKVDFETPSKARFLVNFHNMGHSNSISPEPAGRVTLVLEAIGPNAEQPWVITDVQNFYLDGSNVF